MRTERIEGPNEPDRDKRGHNGRPRPRRGAAQGPIGFGTVMNDVKRKPAEPGALTPGSPNFDPAAFAAAQASVGGQASRAMGASETTEQALDAAAYGVQSATDALQQQDASVTNAVETEPALPTQLGRMSPSTVLTKVLDEAIKQQIGEAMKELHVELEPEDLGPLVVEIKRGPSGKLDIRFRAREADAARVLDAGSELLRERLTEAGFAGADVRVDHDVALVFDRGN